MTNEELDEQERKSNAIIQKISKNKKSKGDVTSFGIMIEYMISFSLSIIC